MTAKTKSMRKLAAEREKAERAARDALEKIQSIARERRPTAEENAEIAAAAKVAAEAVAAHRAALKAAGKLRTKFVDRNGKRVRIGSVVRGAGVNESIHGVVIGLNDEPDMKEFVVSTGDDTGRQLRVVYMSASWTEVI